MSSIFKKPSGDKNTKATSSQNIGALVKKAVDGASSKFDKSLIDSIVAASSTEKGSQIIMNALTGIIDHCADNDSVVYKALKLIYICLISNDSIDSNTTNNSISCAQKKSPNKLSIDSTNSKNNQKISNSQNEGNESISSTENNVSHFRANARLFLPEIASITILNFRKPTKIKYRNMLHILGHQIYMNLTVNTPLPSPSSLELDKYINQNVIKKFNSHNRPKTSTVKNEDDQSLQESDLIENHITERSVDLNLNENSENNENYEGNENYENLIQPIPTFPKNEPSFENLIDWDIPDDKPPPKSQDLLTIDDNFLSSIIVASGSSTLPLLNPFLDNPFKNSNELFPSSPQTSNNPFLDPDPATTPNSNINGSYGTLSNNPNNNNNFDNFGFTINNTPNLNKPKNNNSHDTFNNIKIDSYNKSTMMETIPEEDLYNPFMSSQNNQKNSFENSKDNNNEFFDSTFDKKNNSLNKVAPSPSLNQIHTKSFDILVTNNQNSADSFLLDSAIGPRSQSFQTLRETNYDDFNTNPFASNEPQAKNANSYISHGNPFTNDSEFHNHQNQQFNNQQKGQQQILSPKKFDTNVFRQTFDNVSNTNNIITGSSLSTQQRSQSQEFSLNLISHNLTTNLTLKPQESTNDMQILRMRNYQEIPNIELSSIISQNETDETSSNNADLISLVDANSQDHSQSFHDQNDLIDLLDHSSSTTSAQYTSELGSPFYSQNSQSRDAINIQTKITGDTQISLNESPRMIKSIYPSYSFGSGPRSPLRELLSDLNSNDNFRANSEDNNNNHNTLESILEDGDENNQFEPIMEETIENISENKNSSRINLIQQIINNDENNDDNFEPIPLNGEDNYSNSSNHNNIRNNLNNENEYFEPIDNNNSFEPIEQNNDDSFEPINDNMDENDDSFEPISKNSNENEYNDTDNNFDHPDNSFEPINNDDAFESISQNDDNDDNENENDSEPKDLFDYTKKPPQINVTPKQYELINKIHSIRPQVISRRPVEFVPISPPPGQNSYQNNYNYESYQSRDSDAEYFEPINAQNFEDSDFERINGNEDNDDDPEGLSIVQLREKYRNTSSSQCKSLRKKRKVGSDQFEPITLDSENTDSQHSNNYTSESNDTGNNFENNDDDLYDSKNIRSSNSTSFDQITRRDYSKFSKKINPSTSDQFEPIVNSQSDQFEPITSNKGQSDQFEPIPSDEINTESNNENNENDNNNFEPIDNNEDFNQNDFDQQFVQDEQQKSSNDMFEPINEHNNDELFEFIDNNNNGDEIEIQNHSNTDDLNGDNENVDIFISLANNSNNNSSVDILGTPPQPDQQYGGKPARFSIVRTSSSSNDDLPIYDPQQPSNESKSDLINDLFQ
ncbi:hypothetical protein TRFO_33230 [Tritrichomonas foetus]|uniref:ENTH domain-containing protein n=1 Tax=Tritrichomonas foetus TaxID=1144522 RepID=A0A1J4JRK7_9EUKA|nr:hypothetical protein TRFO_33230 [Tritrichomonas foetus]|eukprot:OHT00156.1 hypothetical protein TRFO_33230 [Tritrichomonas foetus]